MAKAVSEESETFNYIREQEKLKKDKDYSELWVLSGVKPLRMLPILVFHNWIRPLQKCYLLYLMD